VGSSSRAKRPSPSTNALLPERTIAPRTAQEARCDPGGCVGHLASPFPFPPRSTPSLCPRFPHRSGRGRLLSGATFSAIGFWPSCPWRCFSGA